MLVPRLTRLISVLAGLLGASALLCLSPAVAAARPTAVLSEPWPMFSMVYQDTAEAGVQGVTVSQTFQVQYADQRHFSSKVIAHSDARVGTGYSQTFDGDVATTTDPRTGVSHTKTYGPNEFGVPADWLVPRKTPALLLRSGATSSALRPGVDVARVSYGVGSHFVTEEVQYRSSEGIPLSYTQTVDGRVTRQVTVIQLQVGN